MKTIAIILPCDIPSQTHLILPSTLITFRGKASSMKSTTNLRGTLTTQTDGVSSIFIMMDNHRDVHDIADILSVLSKLASRTPFHTFSTYTITRSDGALQTVQETSRNQPQPASLDFSPMYEETRSKDIQVCNYKMWKFYTDD